MHCTALSATCHRAIVSMLSITKNSSPSELRLICVMNSQLFRLFTNPQSTQSTARAGAVCDHSWHWHTDTDLQCLENNAPSHPKESQGEQSEVPVWMQALGKQDRSLLIY